MTLLQLENSLLELHDLLALGGSRSLVALFLHLLLKLIVAGPKLIILDVFLFQLLLQVGLLFVEAEAVILLHIVFLFVYE